MEKQKIQELVDKFNEGAADPSEILILEDLIARGEIDINAFPELYKLDIQWDGTTAPSPSHELDLRFYQMLSQNKKSSVQMGMNQWLSLFKLTPVISLAAITLIGGFFLGMLLSPSVKTARNEVAELSEQVAELKQMWMLSLLEKESASDRLKAVGLVQDLNETNSKVTKALLKTLDEDENINVRLAALEALKPYVNNSAVREGIIHSIAHQESPLVQVALAEFMVSIHEKTSVKELQKILEKESTPEEVKKRIHESISVLI